MADFAKSSNHDIESLLIFEQHDDPDVIIPDRLAFPLVISSHLLLITTATALYFKDYGIAIVILVLYLTSVYHWWKPRFNRMARYLDYAAVLTCLAYGSYYAVERGLKYISIWFCGLSLIGILFMINETLFYFQVRKNVIGDSYDVSGLDHVGFYVCSFRILPTKPNTDEREYVYKRTVWIHLICIHVFANALALGLIIGSHNDS